VNDCLRRGIAAAQRAAPGRQSHLQQPLPRQPSPGSDWDAEQLWARSQLLPKYIDRLQEGRTFKRWSLERASWAL